MYIMKNERQKYRNYVKKQRKIVKMKDQMKVKKIKKQSKFRFVKYAIKIYRNILCSLSNIIEMEQLSKNNQDKHSMIQKLLATQTNKIVNQYKRMAATGDLPFLDIYRSFYDKLFQQMRENYFKFYDNELSQKRISSERVLMSFIHHFKQASDFIWAQLVKQQQLIRLNDKFQAKQAQINENICQNCKLIIAFKNIQLEKARIETGQFSDPFNLYCEGIMQFQDEKETPERWQQIECQQNQKQVYAYINSLKERITVRTSEILTLINHIMKFSDSNYGLDYGRQGSNQKQTYVRTFDVCYRTVIQILEQKIMEVLKNLKTSKKVKICTNPSEQTQTQLSMNEIQNFQKRLDQIQKQLEKKAVQIELSRIKKEQLEKKIQYHFIQIQMMKNKAAQLQELKFQISDQLTKYKIENKEIKSKLFEKQREFQTVTYELKNFKENIKSNKHNNSKLKKDSQNNLKLVTNGKKKQKTNAAEDPASSQNSGTSKKLDKDMILKDETLEQLDGVEKYRPRKQKMKSRRISNISKIERTQKKNSHLGKEEIQNHQNFPLESVVSLKQTNNQNSNSQQFALSQQCINLEQSFVKTPQFNELGQKIKEKQMKKTDNKKKSSLSKMKSENTKIEKEYNKIEQNKEKQIKNNEQESNLPAIKNNQKSMQQFQQKLQRVTVPNKGESSKKQSKFKAMSTQNNRTFEPIHSISHIKNKAIIKNTKFNSESYDRLKSLQNRNEMSIIEPVKSLKNKTLYRLNKNSITLKNFNSNPKSRLEEFSSLFLQDAFQFDSSSKDDKYGRNDPNHFNGFGFDQQVAEQFFSMNNRAYELLPICPPKNKAHTMKSSQTKPNQNESIEIFHIEDVKNLYLCIQGAIEHQKLKPRNNPLYSTVQGNFITKQSEVMTPQEFRYVTKILALIAAIHTYNVCYYNSIKNFLLYPFQSIVSQQNYLQIQKVKFNEVQIKESIIKILKLHKGCKEYGKSNIGCLHLSKFGSKLQSICSLLRIKWQKQMNKENQICEQEKIPEIGNPSHNEITKVNDS